MFSPLEQFEIGIFYSIFVDTFSFFGILDLSFTNLSFVIMIVCFVYYIIKLWIFSLNDEKVFQNPIQNFMKISKRFQKLVSSKFKFVFS